MWHSLALFGRHGDPGVVESPRGAVLGARWPFLILAQRHRKGNPQLGDGNRMLAMRQKSVMSTRLNHFWFFRGHFGGSIWNLVELGKIAKIHFFHLWDFREFLAISRKPERQLFRGNEKIFFWCKIRGISASKHGSHAR